MFTQKLLSSPVQKYKHIHHFTALILHDNSYTLAPQSPYKSSEMKIFVFLYYSVLKTFVSFFTASKMPHHRKTYSEWQSREDMIRKLYIHNGELPSF